MGRYTNLSSFTFFTVGIELYSWDISNTFNFQEHADYPYLPVTSQYVAVYRFRRLHVTVHYSVSFHSRLFQNLPLPPPYIGLLPIPSRLPLQLRGVWTAQRFFVLAFFSPFSF